MEFHAYKTNLGLFLKTVSGQSHANPKFNGVEAQDKYHKISVRDTSYSSNSWWLLEGVQELTSYEVLQRGAPKHVGYTLKISSIASDEIPLNLSLEAVCCYYDDDAEEHRWKAYSDYQALYKPVHEQTEDKWVAQEFKLTVLRSLQIDSFDKPVEMAVTYQTEGRYGSNNVQTADISSIVHYDDIERLLTPEFLLHARPCKISSQQVYSIVRHHIKNNIAPAYATITSDYDFCFTVKRKVAIKPYTSKTEIKTQRGRSYSTPKFNVKSVQHKEVDLFEMTHAGQNYKGYTTIVGWEAPSLSAMKDQIEEYLAALMEEINRPVEECPHCNGLGHTFPGKIGTNVRTDERDK